MNPGVALSCSSGVDVTMTLGSRAVHSDLIQHGPQTLTWTWVTDLTLGIYMALGGKRSHECQPDPGLYRATDSDMVLGSPGLDDAMAPGGSSGHPDLYGPSCSMVPRLQQNHML